MENPSCIDHTDFMEKIPEELETEPALSSTQPVRNVSLVPSTEHPAKTHTEDQYHYYHVKCENNHDTCSRSLSQRKTASHCRSSTLSDLI